MKRTTLGQEVKHTFASRKSTKTDENSNRSITTSLLESMPTEIQELILSYLGFTSLGFLSQTTRSLNQIASSYFIRRVDCDLQSPTAVIDVGYCIKRIISFYSMNDKIDFCAKIQEQAINFGVWKSITNGWTMVETVQFSKDLYNKREYESGDNSSSFELLSNLAYEIITVWNCDRGIEFAIEITKLWTFTQKADFLRSIYLHHVDGSKDGLDMNFLINTMLNYTKDYKDSERYLLLKEVVKDWPINNLESFILQSTHQPTKTNFELIRSFTSTWTNSQMVAFLAKSSGSLYLHQFLLLFKEITSAKQSHQQMELIQQTIVLLKNQYLSSQCSCVDCKKRYLERVSVLAMIGFHNNQTIPNQFANQRLDSL